jgi:TPR repeat protein
MLNLLGSLAKAYAALCAYVVALVAIIAGVLLGTGTLRPEQAREAVMVLRRKPEGPAKAAAAVPGKPVEPPTKEREALLDRKAEDLRRLEDRVGAQIGQMRLEQEALERRRTEAAAAEAASRKAQEELAAAKSDAEIAANLPIMSKMDGAGIVDLVKDWDDPRIVKYLRALKPGKAAEVIEAIRTDPQFEDGFRKLPAGAAPGTKTRAERLNESLTKVP